MAVLLTSGVPTDTSTVADIGEIGNANGYARVNLFAPSASGDVTWTVPTQTADGSGIIENAIAFTFPTCTTANWGVISGVALADSGGYGAGNIIVWGALTVPKTVTVGDTLSFASGDFEIRIN